MHMVIAAYNSGKLTGEFIKSLRNITSADDIDLGIQFQSLIENGTTYRFEELFNKA